MILLIAWILNPELTQMQLVLQYWYCFIADILIIFGVCYINDARK